MSDSAASGRTPGLALDKRNLTPEQEAIVAHTDGPALVFAVAGAGKTTSMVHRIRALVEQGARPKRILASSFSRSTVGDLEQGLAGLGVAGVQCRTLHSLGRSFIAEAERRGHRPRQLSNGEVDPASMARILAAKSRTQLAMERSIDTSALGIAQSDVEDQISAWKTRLAYARLDDENLPDAALEHATQAQHENEDFLTLYRYAERLRKERGWITFDDMLREGWEVLMRYDDVRAEAQGQFDYILVDEFQDVSPVQALLLDVVTEPHRNYMAIGDDDQCIYEWRGADPSFILDFAERYDADEYVISDNFRSTGQQTSLANAVITQNEQRHAKRIHPTRTFDGDTHLRTSRGRVAQARDLVASVQAQLRDGRTLQDLVILVRQYAQTPFIEQALIREQIPYRIVGSSPFYLRTQVQALLRHLFFATLERQVDEGGWFSDRRRERQYLDRFERVLLEPNRYVSGTLLRNIKRRARRSKRSALHVLHTHLGDMHRRTAMGIEDFLDVMDELVERLEEPADQTVEWLIEAMGYEAYIRRHSAFQETAEDRIQTARSLVHFAKGLPSTRALLERVKEISFNRVDDGPGEESLEIRSIHRAKGGEWPVVFLPDCNDGTIPNLTGLPEDEDDTPPDADGGSDENSTPTSGSNKKDSSKTNVENAPSEGLPQGSESEVSSAQRVIEGERRLFYVALTRACDELFLYRDESEPVSPFLRESEAESVLSACEEIRRVMHGAPEDLDQAAVARFCAAVERLSIDRYLRERWTPSPERREGLDVYLRHLASAMEEARSEIEAYEEACDAYASTKEATLDPINDQLAHIRSKKFVLPNVEVPVAYGGDSASHWTDRPVRFAAGEDGPIVKSGSVTLGPVDFSRDTDGVAQEAVAPLDPVHIRGDVARASGSGQTLFVKIDVGATRRRLQTERRQAMKSLAPPEEPGELTYILAGNACRAGHERLTGILQVSVAA